MDNILVYGILLLGFCAGSAFNFHRRGRCKFLAIVSNSKKVMLIIALGLILGVAFLGGNMIPHYVLAFAAWVYLFSAVYGEGIYEDGVFYFNGMTLIILTDTWEQIKKAEIKHNKLAKFTFTSNSGTRVQYYSTEDYTEIVKIISSVM